MRLDLEEEGQVRELDTASLRRLLETTRSATDALAAFQAHRKDVFAPDLFPVGVRADTLLASGARLQLVDQEGAALHVRSDGWLADQLADQLREVQLVALFGDVGLDRAIPTINPHALLVEGRAGLELRPTTGDDEMTRREPPRGWAESARAAGLSAAAISLGEIREELADHLVAGLAAFTPRTAEALSSRLRDLGLGKPAELLEALVARPEPADRVNDYVKLYQVLELALLRISGTSSVDRTALQAVPAIPSVFVKRPATPLPPDEVGRMRARGAFNQYEAAVHYAGHYGGLPPEDLVHDLAVWGDGTAAPYLAQILSPRPEQAIASARRALELAGC